mmetsp:Transcript_60856/g.70654  ORF Transcript_60856/g.70654 Transcript_60856/m.70654 type:complete len:117 (+) Transcript_60856:217-567(+)
MPSSTFTYTTRAEDNTTKIFTSIRPDDEDAVAKLPQWLYCAGKRRHRSLWERLMIHWNALGYEFAMNFLEPIERWCVHIGFWASFAYTMYQFYSLFFVCAELFASAAVTTSPSTAA